jgi:hypothetical protein
MATRFYLPASGTAPLGSLAVDSQWELSDSLDRRPCDVVKSNTSLTQKSATWSSTTTQQWVWVQFQSKRLAAGYSWTTADTVSMVIKCAEAVAQVDSHLCYVIRVVSGDGSTIRGTIGSYLTTSSEYPTSLATIATRIHDARTSGASNFSSQAGDRIIIEIGHHGVSPALNVAYHNYGDPTATQDFSLAAGDTNDYVPWVELSRDVSFVLTDTQPAYTKGASSPTPAVAKAYLEGSNPSYPASDSQPAYTKGSTSPTPTQISAYTRGSTVATPTSISAYLKGGIIATPSSKSAYLIGSTSPTPTQQSAFLQGGVIATPTVLHAFLQGGTGALDNQSAYTSGLAYEVDNQVAFTQGSFYKVENKSAFTQGSIDITDSVLAFLLGGIAVNDSVSAYTEGYTVGGEISTSNHAFTIGIDNNLIPDGDVNKVGVWKNELEQTTNLYLSVDETIADDNDYVYNIDPTDGDYIEFSLTNPSGTPGSGDVVIFVRAKSTTEYPILSFALYQGGTLISGWGGGTTSSVAQTYYLTLTPAQKSNITDWTDLRVRIYLDMS